MNTKAKANSDAERLLIIMQELPASACTYEEWIRIGMVCKSVGLSCDQWEHWSRYDDARWKLGDCASRWKGFSGGVEFGTAAYIARAHGVDVPQSEAAQPIKAAPLQHKDDRPKEDKAPPLTSAQRAANYEAVKAHVVKGVDIFGELFNEGEYIAVKRNNKVECKPEVVTLDAARRATDISHFCPNPVDKEGRVTAYRYFVAESDKAPVESQINAIESLGPLVKLAVYSGNKSVHAFIKVDANSEARFKELSADIVEIYSKLGIEIDLNYKSPSQEARAVGYVREGIPQELIYIADKDNGLAEYWKSFYGFSNCEVIAAENPKEWVLDGFLCRGFASMLVGQAKIGKTFLLFDMLLDIATGRAWLDTFEAPKPRSVFYLSYEMDMEENVTRLRDLAKNGREEGLKRVFMRVFEPSEKTAIDADSRNFERVLSRAVMCGTELVVIDTASWVYPDTLNENDNSDVNKFMHLLADYARKYNVSLLVVHHTAKQTEFNNLRDTIDKAAGAGSFGRHAYTMMVAERGPQSDIDAEFAADHAGEDVRSLRLAVTGKGVQERTLKLNAAFMPTEVRVISAANGAPKRSNTGATKNAADAVKYWAKYYNKFPDLRGKELKNAMNKAAGKDEGKRKYCAPNDGWRESMPRLFEEDKEEG